MKGTAASVGRIDSFLLETFRRSWSDGGNLQNAEEAEPREPRIVETVRHFDKAIGNADQESERLLVTRGMAAIRDDLHSRR